MNIPDVLDRAAARIEERGWWNGGSDPTGTTECVMVAVSRAAAGGFGPRHDIVLWTLKQELGLARWDGLAEWNDRQADGEVVCKTLRVVADRLRAEQ